jgi:hypothetical protein
MRLVGADGRSQNQPLARRVSARHDVGRLPIYKTIALPDGLSRIVLFDSPAGNKARLENLVCVDHCGGLIWTAQLPKDTLPDAFVSVGLNGPMIQANTWSCFALTIDPKTGTTLSCIYTK